MFFYTYINTGHTVTWTCSFKGLYSSNSSSWKCIARLNEVILMPEELWMSADYLKSLLADDPLRICTRQLLGSLPHLITLWRSESRLWLNGIPPEGTAGKVSICSHRWSAMLKDRFVPSTFYLFFTCRAPMPDFLAFLWSLPAADEFKASSVFLVWADFFSGHVTWCRSPFFCTWGMLMTWSSRNLLHGDDGNRISYNLRVVQLSRWMCQTSPMRILVLSFSEKKKGF